MLQVSWDLFRPQMPQWLYYEKYVTYKTKWIGVLKTLDVIKDY